MFNINRKRKEDDLTYLERVYSKVLKKNPDSFLYLPLASIYYHKGSIEKAIKTLQNGLSVNPNHVSTKYYLATLYREKGELNKAVEMFKIVTFNCRDHYAAHKALVHYYLDKKDEKNALTELKELARLVPFDTPIHDKINRLEQKFKKAEESLAPAAKDLLFPSPEMETEDEESYNNGDEVTQISDEVDEDITLPGEKNVAPLPSETEIEDEEPYNNENEKKTGKSDDVYEIIPHQTKKQNEEEKDKQDVSEKVVSSLENWLKNIDQISQKT